VTWVQPEDLVGHELRQAAEEGKDVADVAARWRGAGGADAPGVGASPTPAAPALRRLALELLDELGTRPSPRVADEPEELEAIVGDRTSVEPVPVAPDELAGRIRGAWLGRAAGCLLGKPVEKIPRAGIRELLEAAGRWPLSDYFTARGLPEGVAERWRWNRASRSTSLVENIAGMPEDDDLNYTLLALALLERRGTDFTTEDVAAIWLDLLPGGRVFTAERVAYRNLLAALVPPETATYRNPFREWIGARIRVDVHGWAAAGDPLRAAELAWRDARLSHTANGVYAAMFMAAAHAASFTGSSSAASVDAGLSVIPPRSRLAEAVRDARELATGGRDWERVVDELEERYGAYHWVHAINNTALVAAALCAFDGDYSGAICGVVSGGWDTDSNGAAVGSILGATVGVDRIPAGWVEPLRNRIASSMPGFDGVSFDELASRTLAVCERAGVASPQPA
jgi:ADP-ribosylglycohydrolase